MPFILYRAQLVVWLNSTTIINQYSCTMPHPHLHVVEDEVGVIADCIKDGASGPLPTVENTIKHISCMKINSAYYQSE